MAPSPPKALLRRQIVRSCKTKGWTIQPGPLEDMVVRILQQYQQSRGQDLIVPAKFLEQWVEPEMVAMSKRTITNEVWEQCCRAMESFQPESPDKRSRQHDIENQKVVLTKEQRSMERQAVVRHGSRSQSSNNFWNANSLHIVTAFHQPRLVYNPMRQQFRVEEKEWTLFGTAEEKVEMFAQRYAMIHQRILRHKRFRPTRLMHHSHAHKSKSSRDRDGTDPAMEDDYSSNEEDSSDAPEEMVQFHLTPLEQLLGQRQMRHEDNTAKSILVLGVLREVEHVYCLEDPTGLVPIDLQDAQLSDPENMVLSEDSIYLVEGLWHDGTLRVIRLGPPLLETRQDSLSAIRQQIQHELLAPSSVHHRHSHLPVSFSNKTAGPDQNHPLVILSDVHLDQPQTLQSLEGLLASYESQRNIVPLFCLMGNLSTQSGGSGTTNAKSMVGNGGGGSSTRATTNTPHAASYLHSLLFNELATILRKFPYLAQEAHFVLVPGPNDVPPSAVLPWTLPRGLHGSSTPDGQDQPHHLRKSSIYHRKVQIPGIQNLVLGTNPTRLYWNDQEWVLFRSLSQQQQEVWGSPHNRALETLSQSPSKPQESTRQDDVHDLDSCSLRLIKTMLDQGHLVPGGNTPIYWNYDHAMRLYPLPTGLVVAFGADGATGWSSSSLLDETYGECRVVVPGSLGQSGQYAVVHPTATASAAITPTKANQRQRQSPRGHDEMALEGSGGQVELLQLDPEATMGMIE